MSSAAWGEIAYPFSNFIGCTVEVWEWICNFIPHIIRYNHLSMLRLTFIHVSNGNPWDFIWLYKQFVADSHDTLIHFFGVALLVLGSKSEEHGWNKELPHMVSFDI